MQFDLILLVGLAALAVMLVNLYQAVRLKVQISGGMIGKRWNTMVLLVLLFAVGYLILPFLGALDAQTLRIVVSLVFLFGAVYVLITIRLIYGIIKELVS